METLLVNIGKARRAVVNGRVYRVAPMTLIVPGVLNGSKGPLYYPPDEVSRTADSWNGMPLLLNHPTANDGTPVSGRSPEVVAKSGLGTVYNARWNGSTLVADGWFDEEAVNRIDSRINRWLDQGKRIELSTGLFTDNLPATNGSNHLGVPYSFVARNYRPDHLAILPDQKGACSTRDGCGVLANSSNPNQLEGDVMPLTKAQKKEYVEFIVTNCSCWKGADDKETLNTFSDEKLTALRGHVEESAAKDAVINAIAEGYKAAGGTETLTINAMPAFVKDKMKPAVDAPAVAVPAEEEEEEEVVPPAKAKKPVPPVKNEEPKPVPEPTPAPKPKTPEKPMTANEWLASAPAEIQSAVRNAMAVEQEAKNRLITMLVANAGNDAAKTAATQVYQKMDLGTLKTLAATLPAPVANQTKVDVPLVDWSGTSLFPGPVVNRNDDVDEAPLDLPTINWAEKVA